jgi:lysophospholipase L1-like esterase
MTARAWLRPAGGLARLLLVVGSAAAVLLAVDLVLLLMYGPARPVEKVYETHPQYGYRMRPNLEFRFASPYHGYDAEVRTNSRGLRGAEVVVPRPAGLFRVLLLGDSMVAGLEVDEDETFGAVCAGILQTRRPTEVVNAGVRGYELDNIIGYLQTDGLRLDPDVVVYFFTDNDLASDPDPAPKVSDSTRAFRLAGVTGRLATYSHLTYRLAILRQRVALRRQRDRSSSRAPVFLPGGLATLFTNRNYEELPTYVQTTRRIEKLADLCAGQGVLFVLAGAPQKEEIDPEALRFMAHNLAGKGELDFDGVTRYLDWVAHGLGIERFDPMLGIARFEPVAAFRDNLRPDHEYWFHRDNHLNPSGHRLLGELLAARIAVLPAFVAGTEPARD